ncbi:MAG: hypothetical protein K0Q49_371 [Haloplasmataceae bacterium]|nr:hypothetical protein [Haloplasmataceae bacterium]
MNLLPGEYNVTFQALGNGSILLDSDLTDVFHLIINDPNQSVKLATPFGIVLIETHLEWAAIGNAQNYLVYIEGAASSPFMTIGPTIEMLDKGLTPGKTYNVRIQAIGNGTTYLDSDQSGIFTFNCPSNVKLATPFGIVKTDFGFNWGAQPTATGFYVYVEGVVGSPFNVPAGQYTFNVINLNLPIGTYEIKIQAKGNGGTLLDSDLSSILTFDIVEVIEEVNLAIGALATSNSGDASAPQAIDNNMSSRWESAHGNDDVQITINLGEVKMINTVVLKWEGAYAKQYKLQVSNDNINFTDVYVETNSNGDTDHITLENINAQYVRMQGIERALVYGYSLLEFQIYYVI